MSIWAIVPVKPLRYSKSRMSSVLSVEEREALSREMLVRTLHTLHAVDNIGGTMVVSRDSGALALARSLGAHTLQESGAPDLNASLTLATKVMVSWRVRGVLLLASDVPLLQVEDIENMIALAKRPPVVVLGSDRSGRGINAMLVRPPGLLAYEYGLGSLRRYRNAAERACADVHVYESLTLGLDIDTPADLDLYRELLAEQAFYAPHRDGLLRSATRARPE